MSAECGLDYIGVDMLILSTGETEEDGRKKKKEIRNISNLLFSYLKRKLFPEKEG